MSLSPALPGFLPAQIRAEASYVALTRGEALFRNGETVAHVYFILEGEVLALRYLSDGSEAVMQRARDGEFFAQSAVLVPRYTCDARATCPTEVARLPSGRLIAALAGDPVFARAYMGQLAADLRRQCTRVERLRLKRAKDRVLHYLACEGALAPGAAVLQDWARELGLEPETLYRTLADLEAKRLIRRTGNGVALVQAGPGVSCSS
jgi:CRP-like cAMP-binding protein